MQPLIPAIKAWLTSNRNPDQLYTEPTSALTHHLRAWITRRKVHNDTLLQLMDELIANGPDLDALQYPSGVDGAPVPPAITTSLRLMNLGQPYVKIEASENLIATYLLSTQHHRGIHIPPLPSTPSCAIDAKVCSYLSTVDDTFNASTELDILEATEHNNAIAAQLAALGPVSEDGNAESIIPGLTEEQSKELAKVYKEEMRRYPAISVKQAFIDANVKVFGMGFLDVVKGRRTPGDFLNTLPKRYEDADAAIPDNDTASSAKGTIEQNAATLGQGESSGTVALEEKDEGKDALTEEARMKKEKNKQRREQRKRAASKRKAQEGAVAQMGINEDEGIDIADSGCD